MRWMDSCGCRWRVNADDRAEIELSSSEPRPGRQRRYHLILRSLTLTSTMWIQTQEVYKSLCSCRHTPLRDKRSGWRFWSRHWRISFWCEELVVVFHAVGGALTHTCRDVSLVLTEEALGIISPPGAGVHRHRDGLDSGSTPVGSTRSSEERGLGQRRRGYNSWIWIWYLVCALWCNLIEFKGTIGPGGHQGGHQGGHRPQLKSDWSLKCPCPVISL